MCPLWPFHLILFYFMTFIPVWVICQNAPKLMAEFDPPELNVYMGDTEKVMVNVSLENFKAYDKLHIYTDLKSVASPEFDIYDLTNNDIANGKVETFFNVAAIFLGKASVKVKVCPNDGEDCTIADNTLDIIITRKQRIIDHVFIASVAILVSLIYVNFGCALDLQTVKQTLIRPIAPSIGFVAQFLFMPLISYAFGLLLFPGDANMQLGMFFTGVSPGGGASNIWSYILGGNLNLSITMTTISTFAAFGMMPLWLFTLGRKIFSSGDMVVPHYKIATFAFSLVIPLGIGILSQKYLPKFANMMVRILKTFSALLILFIIVFAIVTNIYIFELFTWRIVVAGLCVPWMGYLFGFLSALIFRQPLPDCLTIGLETGIQNTGIAIYLLKFTLAQPAADLTTVVPISIAIMTPVPLLVMYICILIRRRYTKDDSVKSESIESKNDLSAIENNITIKD